RDWDRVAPLVLADPVSYEATVSQRRVLDHALTRSEAALACGEWQAAVRILSAACRSEAVRFHPEAMRVWARLHPHCPKITLQAAWEVRSCLGHTAGVSAVVLSADGRFALSGSNDWKLRLWDVETGSSLQCFEGHRSYVDAVSLSRDGRLA